MENCCHAPGVTDVTFAQFNPCIGAPYGSTYTLTDERDQKTYKIKYLPDGRYWMVQDLAFGEKCETKTSMRNLTTTGNITSLGTYYGDCYKPACNLDNYGYVYNYTAVMNYGVMSADYTCSGTTAGTLTNAPSTCHGICPNGWHVPTFDELQAMTNAITVSDLCSTAVDAIHAACGFAASDCESWSNNNASHISSSTNGRPYWRFNQSTLSNEASSAHGFTRCAMNY
jgi:uncharacterized protein (TIGR02145 family)